MEDVDAAAKRADGNATAVFLPRNGGHAVDARNLHHITLFPHSAGAAEGEDVELVEARNNSCFATWAECSSSEIER